MDPQVIQRTRYVLHARFRRVQKCPPALFPSACAQLVTWLENHSVLFSLVRRLESQSTESHKCIEKILSDSTAGQGYPQLGFYTADSTDDHAALCFHVLRAVARTAAMPSTAWDIVFSCLGEFLTSEGYESANEAIRSIRDVAIDGVYEYLDEQIDTRNITYSILLKYKQRSEWFYRNRLRGIADEGLEGFNGERGLARDLQEYVFNQHVEFTIEPRSSSGEADLILREPRGRYLIIDAKYIREDAAPSAIRTQLASGFHQVARYCEDYREPEGFLVSFVRSSKRLSLDLEESDGLTFLRLGGKTIYYLAVQISEEPSASKSGMADEITIVRDQLVSAIE